LKLEKSTQGRNFVGKKRKNTDPFRRLSNRGPRSGKEKRNRSLGEEDGASTEKVWKKRTSTK